MNYSAIERHCLASVFATQKLCHYFLAHLDLITRLNPLRYLLSRPAMSGRIAQWLLQLNEFDINVITPQGLRSQALFDLIAQFPSEKCEPLHEKLPCEEICFVETKEWRLHSMVHPHTKEVMQESPCMTPMVLIVP